MWGRFRIKYGTVAVVRRFIPTRVGQIQAAQEAEEKTARFIPTRVGQMEVGAAEKLGQQRFIPTRVGQMTSFFKHKQRSYGSSPRVWGRSFRARTHNAKTIRFIPTRVGQMTSQEMIEAERSRFIPTRVGQMLPTS